jgi:hypothetical protein
MTATTNEQTFVRPKGKGYSHLVVASSPSGWVTSCGRTARVEGWRSEQAPSGTLPSCARCQECIRGSFY